MGRGKQSAAELAEQDDPIHVDHKTIYRWATDRHADEYERVLAEEWPKIKALTAERHRALAETAMAAEFETWETYREALAKGEIPTRDLAGSGRNAAVSSGVHNQHIALLRGEPTERKEYRSSAEVLRELKAMGAIDTEAEEVVDAEVVQSEQLPEGESTQPE